MCMIAYRPVKPGKHGSNIPTQVIETAIKRHPDGFGMAWRKDGQLHTRKYGPENAAAFRDHLKELDRASTVEYVAHWRYATHGPEDEDHAHPFEYTDPEGNQVIVFHNGVIDIGTTPMESDTEVFVRDVLPRLPAGWWNEDALRWMVREAIGWSKLTLMTVDETVVINEKSGEWDGGIWYSSSHKTTPVYNVNGGKSTTVYTSVGSTRDWGAGAKDSAFGAIDTSDRRLVALGLVPDEPVDEDVIERDVDRPYQWHHAGHTLTALTEIPVGAQAKDGEYPNGIMCDECMTIGTVYVIDGTTFIDINHTFEPSALLPERSGTEAF